MLKTKEFKSTQMLELKASTKRNTAYVKLAITDECFEELMKFYWNGGFIDCSIKVLREQETETEETN